MISKQALQDAVQHKLLQPEQLEPLFIFLNNTEQLPIRSDDFPNEPIRFVRSFGDVFITLGVFLLAYAVTLTSISNIQYWIPVVAFIALAEWLVRIRQLVLPGMALLITILYFSYQALSLDYTSDAFYGIAALSAFSLLFYLRYRMPFSIFPFTLGSVALVINQLGFDIFQQPIILTFIGFIVFVVAMSFDVRDIKRQSHLSDTAFWLHLIASPLMVHGIMASLLLTDQQWLQGIPFEAFILVLFSAFFLLALLVDRRAMIISTQLYVLYAITQLVQNQLSNTEHVLTIMLFALALFVIISGTYWYKIRSLIFGFLSTSSISRYLPSFALTDHS